MFKYKNTAVLAALPILLLQGCGGGGDGTTTASSAAWTAGDFSQSASSYANQCNNVRTGIDPYTGKAYPDQAGSSMYEKMFLRAFSHETYLWYDEIPDNNPSNYASVSDYFKSLVTPARTATGQKKDRFHYIRSYDAFMKSQQSGLVSGFGFNWKFIQGTEPRDIRIAYTEDNSPAALKGVERGDKLIKIDHVDVVNSPLQTDVDYINNTLFSPNNNQDYTFTFLDKNGAVKVVTIKAQDVATSPVKNVKVFNYGDKTVGYMQFNAFEATAQQPLINAFNRLSSSNVDEVVMDLRYNGGGLIWQSAQVGYMLSGANQNQVFGQLVYNDKITKSGQGGKVYNFVDKEINWATGRLTSKSLPTLSAKRVYVLTTDNTASSSELLINALRGIDVDVIQIGTTTTGKPYGVSPEANCGSVYYTIQFKSINAKGFGDFADGFIPTAKNLVSSNIGIDDKVEGCVVADDMNAPLGDISEGMLSAALNYMATGNCPAAPSVAPAPRAMPMLGGTPLNQGIDPLRQEAIHVNIN
ncbi:S41 family peptidase [Vibrio harveyi]|uniref:S41 family peptidase n=1 Tax=Vibrio harveyi TaxID=669 RepID=UPI0023802898|nr:S41 family peptidase [Vibrio harveyi]